MANLSEILIDGRPWREVAAAADAGGEVE